MTVKELAQELTNMVIAGRVMEAFEKFYGDDVIVIENNEPERVGKEVNREFHKKFMENVGEVHETKVNHLATDEEKGIAFIYWHFDMTSKDGKRRVVDEVAVQKWVDGKIVKERFFYDTKENV